MHFLYLNKAAVEDAFDEHTSELSDCMKDKVMVSTGKRATRQASQTNPTYNKHPIPWDQVIKKTAKIRCTCFS